MRQAAGVPVPEHKSATPKPDSHPGARSRRHPTGSHTRCSLRHVAGRRLRASPAKLRLVRRFPLGCRIRQHPRRPVLIGVRRRPAQPELTTLALPSD